ncbi:MAG: AbrB/MazE/SpoVT family DNA-binding domain-containing protein [Synergistaceae bacterium]|jgi:bifunctional DNA-binding transcriptional regulator/antitoxin component of YhaV-PrlF toxin-antitoxin module|nr:AbrB/MazE/SpoVT family DNA-binding domain-containing protein [Synergistaceae bacterium]
MLTVLRDESQITLPEALVEKLGVSVGDSFHVSEKEGVIRLTPMSDTIRSVWPKEFIELLGSIDDDTFVEPEDISFSDRETF